MAYGEIILNKDDCCTYVFGGNDFLSYCLKNKLDACLIVKQALGFKYKALYMSVGNDLGDFIFSDNAKGKDAILIKKGR